MALRVALVHDWLTGMRGGEKVLEVLCELFPQAPLFTLVHTKGALSSRIEGMTIRTSFVQRLPFSTSQYRRYLPVLPLAIESFDFSAFDLIVSTSHCVAKGARPADGALHVCYCHTPMRYVWEMYDEYFGKGRAGLLTRAGMSILRPALQQWDVKTSTRVHAFIANSRNVADRIRLHYGRDADVLYPPVETSRFGISAEREGYWLVVSALVPYKRVDLAVRAFTRLGRRLVIAGSGPEAGRLKRIAGPTISFLGWVPDRDLPRLYARAEALIFPGEEDFGIVPLEAMASGRPVVAFARGGALETIVDHGPVQTGVFFKEQTEEALIAAVEQCAATDYDPYTIRAHALQFDTETFRRGLKTLLSEKVEHHFGPDAAQSLFPSTSP